MVVVNVVGESGDYEVWLDTEVAECDGLVIGLGATRAEALADALDELRNVAAHIQQLQKVARRRSSSVQGS